MEIICPGCHTRYNLPDDKIPKTGKISIRCPKCNHKITISREKGSGPPEEKTVITDTEKQGPASTKEPAAESDITMEFFEPGTKTALFFCPQSHASGEIAAQLSQLGFETRKINSLDELVSRLRYHVYDLILICKLKEDDEAATFKLLEHINKLPMQTRRNILVIYCHLTGNKLDTMQAFLYGVDITINPLDLGRLMQIIEHAEQNHTAKYSVFNDCKALVEKEAF